MARDELNREDLLREATALVERIELLPHSAGAAQSLNLAEGEPIVVGFRADGALSAFFGSDPVYQFNAGGELRRAYVGGLLFKAAQGRLISLNRVRTASEVQLVRHALSSSEESQFVETMAERLQKLETVLAGRDFTVAGQVPPDADILGRVRMWLAANINGIIAARPNA
jgi:hypothetical protein